MNDSDFYGLSNLTRAQRDELAADRTYGTHKLRNNRKWKELSWPPYFVPKRLAEPGKRLDRCRPDRRERNRK